ncbi:MAG: PAS domain-containing protein, partial [candidate division Zixibacteria bacterium]|nr:PAS domain-containing protein [candidate division Zixibacteria bacterium]
MIVFVALGILGFGLWAIGILSNGLQSFTQREYLNAALELETRMQGALFSVRRLQEETPESKSLGNPRQAFEAYRTNFLRYYDELAQAVAADSQSLQRLAGVSAAVQSFFAHTESVLQINDRIGQARAPGRPASPLQQLRARKAVILDSARRAFLDVNEGLQRMEENFQGRRKELLSFQVALFKRLYLITASSLFFGGIVVWLLMRVRASQKRERNVSESLSQTLAEIKGTEEALRGANERFHLAASATSGVIYDWEIESGHIVWTENISSVFGYAAQDVDPQYDWWEKRIHPSDLERIRIQLKENLASQKDFIGEYRFRHQGGHYIDVWDKGRVVRNASGKVVRMVGSMVDVSEQKRVEKALRSIAERISSSTGAGFFRALVRHLASALGAKYALVGEITDETLERVRTLAVWAGEEYGKNFEYALAGTPCENVVGKSLCLYPSGIQEQFPDDPILNETGAESYLGTPLSDSAGRPLGLLAVLHTEPMADEYDLRSILNIFAARAAAELERKRT